STISELLDALADQTQSDQGRDSSSAPVVLVNGKRILGVNEIVDLPPNRSCASISCLKRSR
ncbi:hypothetical protein ABTJ98_20390, partial [Acinetobacter baumannii]